MKIKEISPENRPKKLPEFKGYTIDFRLGQFRKVDIKNQTIEFIDFSSQKGRILLTDYYEKLSSSNS